MKEQSGLHPPGPKSPFKKRAFGKGQDSEEDVAGEGTLLGAEEDAVANIAGDIEGEISKYKKWSALPFYDNDELLAPVAKREVKAMGNIYVSYGIQWDNNTVERS
jgi:hypothetical protein